MIDGQDRNPCAIVTVLPHYRNRRMKLNFCRFKTTSYSKNDEQY